MLPNVCLMDRRRNLGIPSANRRVHEWRASKGCESVEPDKPTLALVERMEFEVGRSADLAACWHCTTSWDGPRGSQGVGAGCASTKGATAGCASIEDATTGTHETCFYGARADCASSESEGASWTNVKGEYGLQGSGGYRQVGADEYTQGLSKAGHASVVPRGIWSSSDVKICKKMNRTVELMTFQVSCLLIRLTMIPGEKELGGAIAAQADVSKSCHRSRSNSSVNLLAGPSVSDLFDEGREKKRRVLFSDPLNGFGNNMFWSWFDRDSFETVRIVTSISLGGLWAEHVLLEHRSPPTALSFSSCNFGRFPDIWALRTRSNGEKSSKAGTTLQSARWPCLLAFLPKSWPTRRMCHSDTQKCWPTLHWWGLLFFLRVLWIVYASMFPDHAHSRWSGWGLLLQSHRAW